MGSMLVIRIMEIGLFAGLIIHTIQGLVLTGANNSKRKVGYAVDYGNRGSKWYSRSMGLFGTLLLLFLIMHIYHFWIPSRFGGMWVYRPLEETHYESTLVLNIITCMLKWLKYFKILIVVIAICTRMYFSCCII